MTNTDATTTHTDDPTLPLDVRAARAYARICAAVDTRSTTSDAEVAEAWARRMRVREAVGHGMLEAAEVLLRDLLHLEPKPMAAASNWAVTDLEHRPLTGVAPCAECLAHAESAAVHARVTGSRGATYGDGTHSATVARQYALVQL